MRKGKYAKRGMAGKTLVLVLALVMLIGGTVGGTLAWLTDKTPEVKNTFTDSDIKITLDETGEDEVTTEDGKQRNFKMIPGWTIDKDPKVSVVDVKTNVPSEDCWLFVEITESTNPDLDTYIEYEIADQHDAATNPDGWQTVQTGTNGVTVIGRKVYKEDATKSFSILGAGTYTFEGDTYTWGVDEVLVKPEVTKQMMDAIDGFNDNGTENEDEKQPTLTFTAYAVQLWKSNKPANMDDADAVAKAQFSAADAWAKAAAMKPTTGSGT